MGFFHVLKFLQYRSTHKDNFAKPLLYASPTDSSAHKRSPLLLWPNPLFYRNPHHVAAVSVCGPYPTGCCREAACADRLCLQLLHGAIRWREDTQIPDLKCQGVFSQTIRNDKGGANHGWNKFILFHGGTGDGGPVGDEL